MNKSSDHEVIVNPVLLRPSALRSILSVFLSSQQGGDDAVIKMLHPYNRGSEPDKTS